MIAPPASPFYSPYRTGSSGPFPPPPNHHPDALSNISILVAAFLAILATGGPTYSFGVYAAALKDTFDLSQSQLETLGAASFAAGLISWIPGLCVDAWGSRAALLVGGLLQSLGLFMYWMVVRVWASHVPSGAIVFVLSCLSVIIFSANNLVIGGVFKAIVVSCGLGSKGKAVGAAKAYLGLGAGVFLSLFQVLSTFWNGSDLDFLAMSAIVNMVAIVLSAFLALPTKDDIQKVGMKDESTPQHYHVVYVGLFALALVVMGSSIMALFPTNERDEQSFQIPAWLNGILILTLWIGPILGLFWVPTVSANRKQFHRSQSSARRRDRQAMERDHILPTNSTKETARLIPPIANTAVKDPTTYNATLGTDESEEDEDICETPQPVEDVNLIQMLQTLPAWLFLCASTILVGSGTMVTINCGNLVQSQQFAPQTCAACLAIFSVTQALARVSVGAVSEAALQWKTRVFGIRGVPRPAFLVICCAFAVVGHAVMAVASSSLAMLVTGIALTGISFGGLWPLMVLIVGDLFGTVNHGANYMFADGFTCAVGTLSIAKFLTQAVYERHIKGEETACYGDACFQSTHFIISGLCLVSFFACVGLLHMTRSSYGSLPIKGVAS